MERETERIRVPLSNILDEMDSNIRSVIEAARRAEEAAKAARDAAASATKASDEAVKRAEDAQAAGEKAAKEATRAATRAAAKAEKTAKAARVAAEEAIADLATEAEGREKLLRLLDVIRVEMEEVLESVDSGLDLRPEIKEKLQQYLEHRGDKTDYRSAQAVAESLALEW